MTSALAPWHMWGTTATVAVPSTADERQPVKTQQLAAVHYKRPETWEFLLSAFLIQPITIVGVAPFFWKFQVEFDLIIGVGRNSVTLALPEFIFDPNVHSFTANDDQTLHRFCTSFQATPISDEPAPVGSAPNVFDHFPAENIQCTARCFYSGVPDTGTIVTCTVGSFFSPRSHIRPDWAMQHFAGQELGGR